MNRTGLTIALTIAVMVGILFGTYSQLDLDISELTFQPKPPVFLLNGQFWAIVTRRAALVLISLLALTGFLVILGKLFLPRRRMPIKARAALLLVVTIALGPGLVTNVLLKEHWGRWRPIDIQQFGGANRFTPWWDPRGGCRDHCSFIAGEPSAAFWTLAPAALTPPQWRLFAFGAALIFGAGIGALRIGAGTHFLTDVVFAGVFMYLVVWAVHGLIYRWRATRTTDEAIDGALTRTSAALAALARRLAAAGKGS
jgi:membrane-associated PAP2 superfamily phosphatase